MTWQERKNEELIKHIYEYGKNSSSESFNIGAEFGRRDALNSAQVLVDALEYIALFDCANLCGANEVAQKALESFRKETKG